MLKSLLIILFLLHQLLLIKHLILHVLVQSQAILTLILHLLRRLLLGLRSEQILESIINGLFIIDIPKKPGRKILGHLSKLHFLYQLSLIFLFCPRNAKLGHTRFVYEDVSYDFVISEFHVHLLEFLFWDHLTLVVIDTVHDVVADSYELVFEVVSRYDNCGSSQNF